MSLKCRITPSIAVLTAFNRKINNLQKKGENVSASKWQRDIIKWEEMKTVFKDKIKTGPVINLKHKGIKNFLDDRKVNWQFHS